MSLQSDAETSANVQVGGADRCALVYDAATHIWNTKTQAGVIAPLVSGVSAFNSRTGAVTPLQADYDAFFLTPTEGDAAYQPKDATLTALAAADWAANALPIGTGANTLTQTSFAANTFPGRSASGNLIAKAMTDAGFAFVAAADVAAETALLNVATTSLKGLMSITDKTRSDNWYNVAFYNVLDNGVSTANSGATNLTAINALMTAAVDNATIFFPPSPSTYDFSGVITTPGGKHFRFAGGGNQKSIIRTTSGTANIFAVGDWYNEFIGLKFTSSVVRTAGAAIQSGNNVAINVYDCDFTAMFNGIDYSGGANSGNLAIVRNCHWTDTVNFSVKIDGTNANTIVVECTADCTVPAVAHVELNACGSLLIANSDFIRATNNMRMNPDSGTKGVFSVYCTNVFFDTAAGSSVKVQGGAAGCNVQRAKFTNCWFSGSATGFEFAANTSTNKATAFDFVNCDIYGNSANGILGTEYQDFAVTNSRISGNTTAGISVSAIAGVSRFNFQNNRIGPTAGFGVNGTGILIAAGTYAGYTVTANDVSGNTTNITDGGSVTGFNQKQIQDNIGHAIQGQLDALAAATAGFNTTETILAGGLNVAPIPANSLAPKDSFIFKIWGTCTTTVANATTIRIRIGTAGTTGDGVVFTAVTPVAAVTGTAIPWEINGAMIVRTIGAAAGPHGTCVVTNQSLTSNATASTGIMVFAEQVIVPTLGNFNSTVNNYISLSMQTAAATTTHTVQGAILVQQ